MRNNKKGFTIVELVIVIAVIAILSAVLIPTFSGIIGKAQETTRDQEARSLYTNYLTENATNNPVQDGYVVVDGHYYTLAGGQVTVDGDQPTEAPADLGTETSSGSGIYTKVVTP